jgi:hypothetical protein
MTAPVSVTVSSGVAVSAKSTSKTPGDHVAVFNLAWGLGSHRSVNCHWSVCRIGVGLEYSPGLKPDTPGRPKGIADPRLHGRGLAFQVKGRTCTEKVRRPVSRSSQL